MWKSSPNKLLILFLQKIPQFTILQREWTRPSSLTICSKLYLISFLVQIEANPYIQKENTSDLMVAEKSKRKNHLLAAGKGNNPLIDLYDDSVKSLFGGLMGMDDSQVEQTLSFAKYMRMRDLLDEAFGFLKR